MMAGRGSRHYAKLDRRRWARVRRAVFARDGWRCVDCRRAGRLECDHIVPLHVDPDQDPYAIDGLATRCRRCHIQKTAAENRKPDPERDAWRELVAEITNS